MYERSESIITSGHRRLEILFWINPLVEWSAIPSLAFAANVKSVYYSTRSLVRQEGSSASLHLWCENRSSSTGEEEEETLLAQVVKLGRTEEEEVVAIG
jgi:hypothetical protein